jgi:23S rRNA (cytidine1920-2'-O)/16S rRNA (cytidine1409-2'-O)-methyltransferase
VRLDQALVARGLARSRSHARQLVDSGRVVVAGQTHPRAACQVEMDTVIRVEADRYVSRGAHKLIGALDAAPVVVPARVLDAGASTGGFTQVVLERGAEVVYAVDVGHGQLAPALREDPRVRVVESLNLRDLRVHDVDGRPVGLVVADVSFISLRLILGQLLGVLDADGAALVLVKPQFEVGRGQLDSHGVVASEHARLQGVAQVVEHAEQLGWELAWSAPSVLAGEKGNREVFCLFRRRQRTRS